MNVELKRIDRSLNGWLVGVVVSFVRTTLCDWEKKRIPFMHTRVFCSRTSWYAIFLRSNEIFSIDFLVLHTRDSVRSTRILYCTRYDICHCATMLWCMQRMRGVTFATNSIDQFCFACSKHVVFSFLAIETVSPSRWRWWFLVLPKGDRIQMLRARIFIDEIWRGYTWWVCTRVPRRQANTITRNAPTFGKINKTKRRRRRMCYAICNR